MKKRLAKIGFYSGLVKMVHNIRPPVGFRILMYHHVTDEEEIFLPHVTVRVFSRQMKYLHREYQVMDLNDIIEMLDRGETVPPRAVVLTFDDGYEDVYRNAFPVLKEYDLPATVFVSTGFVDSDRLPWTDELGFLFKETAKVDLGIEVGERRERFSWRDEAARLGAFREVKNRLKELYDPDRVELCDHIKEQLAVSSHNPVQILTSSKIREMGEAGISFGSHTVHHQILTRISPRLAQEEIRESKLQLERILSREVKGFCYPNGGVGDFNDVIKSMVQHAGFQYACTTVEGVNGPGRDRFALRRTWTSERSLSLFAARLLKGSV